MSDSVCVYTYMYKERPSFVVLPLILIVYY